MSSKCKLKLCFDMPADMAAFEYVEWKFKGDDAESHDREMRRRVWRARDTSEEIAEAQRYLRSNGFRMVKIKDRKSDDYGIVEIWEK